MDDPAVITYTYSYPMHPPTPVLLELSENAEEVLGYSEAEWRADPYLWQKLLHPEDARIVGIATDAPEQFAGRLPAFALDAIDAIATFVLKEAAFHPSSD